MGSRSQSTASKYGALSKSRKAKHKTAARQPVLPAYTPSADSGASPAAPPAAAPRTPSAVPRYVRRGQPAMEALSTDYSYVAKDLRQIALTAVAMFAIIAILYFILR